MMQKVIIRMISSHKLLLFAVLVFAFALRAYNLDYNSFFFDEAIYILLGRQIINGGWISTDALSWVGGLPQIYPLLSATAYNFGGLTAARRFNVLLGTAAVLLIYKFTVELKLFGRDRNLNHHSGLLAALFFSFATIPVWLSRLAIYDILAAVLLLSGVILLQKGSSRADEQAFLYASILLLIAFLTKYSVLITFPVIIGGVLLYAYRYQQQNLDNAVFFTLVLLFGVGLYFFQFFPMLNQFFFEQVMSGDSVTAGTLLLSFAEVTSVWFLLAFLGATVLFYTTSKKWQFSFIPVAFIPFIFNMATDNPQTVQQNSIFSLLPLLPLGGAWFVWLVNRKKNFGLLILAIFLLFSFSRTYTTRVRLENVWANSEKVLGQLKEKADRDNKILAELDAVAILALEDKIPAENIEGPFSFSYQDEVGESAYKKAVADRYFAYIQLGGTASMLGQVIEQELQENYTSVYNGESFQILQAKSDEEE